MDFKKLFETQKKLDDRIVKEKGLQGQDLLDEKILALQVELGELANEWRGFKFWSEDQAPRTEHICELCDGAKEISATTDTGSVGETYEVYDTYEVDVECPLCEGDDDEKNPLLEEYVDCLHFILSIGNDLELVVSNTEIMTQESITSAFLDLFELISTLPWNIDSDNYSVLLTRFIELGEMLGFTWEQIEQAYYEKNEINHERQQNGY